MSTISLVFPHQLFEDHPALKPGRKVLLVEEYLFFRQYPFHKQKILFQRASMKFYEKFLVKNGYTVEYIDSTEECSDVEKLIPALKQKGIEKIYLADPTDNWLELRLKKPARRAHISLEVCESPMFINSNIDNDNYFQEKKSFRQTDFYIHQRKKHRVLIFEDNKPLGDKWTFDTENRKKYPAGNTPPQTSFPPQTSWHREAETYVQNHFTQNPGTISKSIHYPVTFKDAREWLQQFFRERFHHFGTYQDSMVKNESLLHHSLLSPMMNNGLITAKEVIEKALEYGAENRIPMNSREGFIRQILGWREFIRAVYRLRGGYQRTRNFWGFSHKLPESFWKGTTGMDPLDEVIHKVLNTGYCHHIERLMILGNFMLLCATDPDEVYRWFMEMFVDAWDWVMVPNVYGMSQFADGGLMSTKPYISGSNYILKMSNYPKGNWQETWDALFWRFIHNHRSYFLSNPRLGMMVRSFDKMQPSKQNQLLQRAEKYLATI